MFGSQQFDRITSHDPLRLIIDGGANVGYASLYFANKYPDAEIIAIEPNPENCALFRKNCATYSNIELIWGGLWSSKANLEIENPSDRSHAFRVVETPSPTDDSFEGFAVRDLLARSRAQYIDLMKLDIEGVEEQLFSSNYDDWIGHVKKIMVEPHGTRRREAVSAVAKARGFSVYKRGEYIVLERRASRAGSAQGKPVEGSSLSGLNAIDDRPEHPKKWVVVPEKLKTEEEWRLEVRRSIEHVHGPEEIAYEEDELVVVCLVRDGRPYVESFIDHYFSLGVKHIVFLDNNSEDGTAEVLKSFDGVTVLRTELPYKAIGAPVGNGWTREILFKQYLSYRFSGKNRWCLCVDIDELFDYPYSDIIGLESLLRYLTNKQYTAMVAQMLDMFPEAPLSGQMINPAESLKASHKFYDISNMKRGNLNGAHRQFSNTLDSDEIRSFRGGIRESIFGHTAYLTKMPLVFNDGQARHMDTSHRATNVSIANCTGVLLHYKFLDKHFHEQIDQSVREEHRLRSSSVYKIYKETLDKNPSLRIKRDTARELKSVNELVENDILVVSDDYVEWVDAEEERRVPQTAEQSGPHELAESLLESRSRERAKTLTIQSFQRQLRRQLRRQQALRQRANRSSNLNLELEHQLQVMRSSRSWRFLDKINRLRKRIRRTSDT